MMQEIQHMHIYPVWLGQLNIDVLQNSQGKTTNKQIFSIKAFEVVEIMSDYSQTENW